MKHFHLDPRDQDLNQKVFQTVGYNQLVDHKIKLMGHTLFVNEIDDMSVSHQRQTLFHKTLNSSVTYYTRQQC